MSDDQYRVSADAALASTWITTEHGTHQATRKDVSIVVKDGMMTGDDNLNLEMWHTGDKPQVLNLWKFEDIDEFEALAEMMLDRAEEMRSNKELGLVE